MVVLQVLGVVNPFKRGGREGKGERETSGGAPVSTYCTYYSGREEGTAERSG